MIPVVLLSGLVILGVDPFWQNIVIGAMLILAVGFDQFQRERIVARSRHARLGSRATPTTIGYPRASRRTATTRPGQRTQAPSIEEEVR